MINKKQLRLTVLIIIVVIMLSACTDTTILESSSSISVEETLKHLTSKECGGRLPGTEGNKNAKEYIEKTFKSIGLEPYGDGYLFEYTHEMWEPKKENYSMDIRFSNGEVLECKYGEDFLESKMSNINYKGDMVKNYEYEDAENKFVLLEGLGDIEEVLDKARGALVLYDKFKKGSPKYVEDDFPIIQISPELYNELKSMEIEEVSIEFDVEAIKEEIPENNVVGIIPGENNKNAIVLTAHFDHVGSKGNIIWPGAIDNASGVSALLDIAEKLKKYSEKEKFKHDIVICGFNGEESFFQGSTPFVEDISKRYENIYNINIDSVGLKDGGKLLIDGMGENNKLIKIMDNYLKDKDFITSVDKELIVGISDHTIFIERGINGVGLSQEGCEEIIHTSDDNIEKVDIEYIEKLSAAISDFIIENSGKTFKLPKNNQFLGEEAEKTEEEKIVDKELETLDFNQYKYIELDGKEVLVRRDYVLFIGPYFEEDQGLDVEKFNSTYPQLPLIEKLGEYELGHIFVLDDSEDYVKTPELNKVYTLDTKIENIESINFWFSSSKNSLLINIGVEKKGDRIEGDTYLDLVLESNVLGDEEVKISGEDYNLLYKKENNKLNGLYKKVEKGDRNYHIKITTDYEEDWPYETIDETVMAYKDLNIAPFIEGIVEYLK